MGLVLRLVPATGPSDDQPRSQGLSSRDPGNEVALRQVASCELSIFASKSSPTTSPMTSPMTSPTNSNQFEVLGQVPATCFSKHFK